MKIDIDAVARLRAVIKTVGTQKAAAKQLGCSTMHVYDLLNGNRSFSESMLNKLGLRRTVIEAHS